MTVWPPRKVGGGETVGGAGGTFDVNWQPLGKFFSGTVSKASVTSVCHELRAAHPGDSTTRNRLTRSWFPRNRFKCIVIGSTRCISECVPSSDFGINGTCQQGLFACFHNDTPFSCHLSFESYTKVVGVTEFGNQRQKLLTICKHCGKHHEKAGHGQAVGNTADVGLGASDERCHCGDTPADTTQNPWNPAPPCRLLP